MSLKEEDMDETLASSPAPLEPVADDHGDTPGSGGEEEKKRRKTAKPAKKPSEEVLQRRREGRIKAAATIAQNLKKTGIGRFEDHNGFSLTSVKTVPLINQKNYFAEYLKKDDQIAMIRNYRNEKLKEPKEKEEEEEDEEDDEDSAENARSKMGHDTIVIHPGSQVLRIGRATDSIPVEVPMVVAVKKSKPTQSEPLPVRQYDEDGNVTFGEDFDTAKAAVTKDFKARMRYYKRRMVPNSRESAAAYNKNQRPEPVPDNSDPAYREFYEADDAVHKRPYVAGSDALRLPLGDDSPWRLRSPIVHGTFNQGDEYCSQQDFLGDLSRIMDEALRAVGLDNRQDMGRLKCLFIIPDLYEKPVVEHWVDMLVGAIGFGKISLLQEAVAATFGSGVSCACVVDVGAQKTTIACVDEGLVITDSRVSLDYGGDHVTEAFSKMLLQQNFPFGALDLARRTDDWELADRLKRNFGTFDDADIAVQLYSFYQRRAGGATSKYSFKVYDEVMLAPLGLFYPSLFDVDPTPKSHRLFPEAVDIYTGEPNDPFSKAQDNLLSAEGYCELADESLLLKLVDEKHAFKQANAAYGKVARSSHAGDDAQRRLAVPLDRAIIESITNAGIATDFGKAQKMYDNLLVVGGGLAKFPGFDVLLNDRINIWRPKFLSSSALDSVLQYVTKEKDRVEAQRKALVAEAKSKIKQEKGQEKGQEEVELSEEELHSIEQKVPLRLDLAEVDAISDAGSTVPVNVLPAPKELDPQITTWKGGSVYGSLKVVNDMWITKEDWELMNSRCLYYKSLFSY